MKKIIAMLMVISLILALAACSAQPQITLQDYLDLQAERDALAAEVERLTAEAEARGGGSVGGVGEGVEAAAQPAEGGAAAQVGGELDGTWEHENVIISYDGRPIIASMVFQGNQMTSIGRDFVTGQVVAEVSGTFSISGDQIESISEDGRVSTNVFFRIDENTFLIDGMEYIRVSGSGGGGAAAGGGAAQASGELDGTWDP